MVAVDYFTKYVEAEALATIIATRIIKFVYDTIFYRHEVPTKIVLDNGTLFDNTKFRRFCDDHKVQKGFFAVAKLLTNGQVEAINKTLKQNLKTRLESLA